jgi:hypothetical protein
MDYVPKWVLLGCHFCTEVDPFGTPNGPKHRLTGCARTMCTDTPRNGVSQCVYLPTNTPFWRVLGPLQTS